MNALSLISFLCIVGIGSYLQAFTGFALSIFVLGAVVMFQLVSLDTTATAINIMTLANSALALRGNMHLMNGRLLRRTLLGVLPGVPIGLWILDRLNASSAQILQLVFGVVVIIAGATLCVRPKPRTARSGTGSFVVAGALGGVLGGMFSVPGPPVIYHFYVQPLALEQVRLTLLGIFGAVALVRLVLLATYGAVGSDALYLGLLSLPVVALTTAIFIRFPPRLSETTIRRAAFVLLSGMGVGILLMASR
ncbi:MAG TPA: TSUP family transporter [Ramlibacter sp.]|nr:TSUP family transporter [Ramlibacter sp.]